MDPIPSYSDSLEWITAYFTVHSLSVPSRRYSFLLWLAIVFIFLAFAVLHWTGSRGGILGAVWSKWALRRRTWRKKHTLALAQNANQPHRQPVSLPSNAQILSAIVLTMVSLAFAFIGPDYLDPSLKVWQFQAFTSSPYDASTFVPYMPHYTISKSLWSSSARVGQIVFALLPLCVLFALKAPPFAVFAIPFMTQLYFDKLAWLHRWVGRLIWFLVFLHVALWSIQLAKDVNPSTGRAAYIHAWSYTPFIYGWIAFVLLTLIVLLSLHSIRRRFYEHFYISHLLLVPSMLVMAGLHHPTIALWCWVALSLWIGERLWRGTWWIYANGIMSGVVPEPPQAPPGFIDSSKDAWEMGDVSHPANEGPPSPLDAYYLHDDKSVISADNDTSQARLPASLPHLTRQDLFRTTTPRPPSLYIPPPGYVHAELLSGRTVRLRLITSGFLPWSPGQHFLLNIPSVSRFTSHPFTCASVCDEQAPTDAGRIMLFLVRAKSGWTQGLWDLVSRLTEERSRGVSGKLGTYNLPKNGVLLRAYADGPFGSSKGARWENFSTCVIITGGSGVSFGLTLLQYMCMCLAGRDGRHLGGRPGGWGRKGAELKRVRFIWLVREYSHIQWCASIVRHCMSLVPLSALQVDIYVTRFKPVPPRHLIPRTPPRARLEPNKSGQKLQLSCSNLVREDSFRSRSTDSIESHESDESDVDLSYYLGESPDADDEPAADEMQVAHETNILDLTNFDGDVDMASPGDVYLSHTLKKEGRLRRLRLRRASAGVKQDGRLSRPLSVGESLTPLQDPRQFYPDWHTTQSRLSPVSPSPKLLTVSTHSPTSERSHLPSPEIEHSSDHSESTFFSHSTSNLVPVSSDLPPTVSLVTVNGGPSAPVYSVRSYHGIETGPGNSPAIYIPSPVANVRHLGSHAAGGSPLTAGVSDAIHPFQMDEQEAADVNVVSEHARPGKPKLDKLIADEVQASKGATIVACCGPTSLNAVVRKIVAAQIDPERIRKGDMRGTITLVSEEFEY